MVQLSRAVEPFGEVNVERQSDGTIAVRSTILMVPSIEGAKAGLAVDASVSMKQFFGISTAVSSVFQKFGPPNVVEPVTRSMAEFLAGFSAEKTVEVVYWACGPEGKDIEAVGRVGVQEAATLRVCGPKVFGRNTHLLPAMTHFVDKAFQGAPWSIVVFVTDGALSDKDDVKKYSWQFAEAIASGQRQFVKLVIIGVCNPNTKEEELMGKHLLELDDMFNYCRRCNEEIPEDLEACPKCSTPRLQTSDGEAIDLWDHKIARNMSRLEEVFAEVVSEKVPVLPEGEILDSSGTAVKRWPDKKCQGLPGLLRFRLPAGSRSFTLKCPAGEFVQDITEGLPH
jgi:hypothetical protein